MATFGSTGARIDDDGDQLSPPPELTERDPDPYGEAGDPPDIAAIAESDVEVIDPRTVEPAEDPGTAMALVERFDVTKGDETWPYDRLEFEGDLLGVRLPTKQALAGFSLASSKYVSLGVKNDLTGLFIARHLSPESYGRVFSRLMDPDDDAYGVETVGELFNAIVTASIEADKEQ